MKLTIISIFTCLLILSTQANACSCAQWEDAKTILSQAESTEIMNFIDDLEKI